MKVKICGVTRPADARLAAKLGAWAVGMIFVPNTPRYLTLARAKRVRAAIPKGVLAVGVFRNPNIIDLARAIDVLNLDAVQMYADKSFVHVFSSDMKLRFLEPKRTDADRRRGRGPLDASRRRVWRRAAELKRRGARVVLAGGLTPENVAEAVKAAKPWALDVSSGVESRPGVKDAALLRAFFKAAQ
ncbi:MAG: phosphoribosylanthranilate isomerase [Elusimicrobiota bacterium]